MDTKYRSSPIEGYITDAAGNVLRNTTIRIKEEHPGGLVSDIESIKTDNNGYYVSSPLKRGAYSLYDGGVRLARKIHNPQACFEVPAFTPNPKASPDPTIMSAPWGQNVVDTVFLQIEPDDRDIDKFGHSFEVFDRSKYSSQLRGYTPFQGMPSFYFSGSTRLITNRRFDVFYNDEITGANIMWRGVPAIVLDSVQNTQLVLPLDQFSMFPKRLKQTRDYLGVIVPNPAMISAKDVAVDTDIAKSTLTITLDGVFDDDLKKFVSSLSVGDIVMINTTDEDYPSDEDTIIWARVVYKTNTSNNFEIKLQDWLGRPAVVSGKANKKSSYLFGSGVQTIANGSLTKADLKSMYIFDGMTKSLDAKSATSPQSIRRRFYVFESAEASSLMSKDNAPFDNEMFDYKLNS